MSLETSAIEADLQPDQPTTSAQESPSTSSEAQQMEQQPQSTAPQKTVTSLILDAGPLIKNIPSLSTLLATATTLYTTPTVLSEIRDPDARSRVQTLYTPFLTVRTPRPINVKKVADFAARTGDRDVLSRADLEIVALTLEVECEREGGGEDVRYTPGGKVDRSGLQNGGKEEKTEEDEWTVIGKGAGPKKGKGGKKPAVKTQLQSQQQEEVKPAKEDAVSEVAETLQETHLDATSAPEEAVLVDATIVEDDNDSDSDSWITPANIKEHQERDEDPTASVPGAAATSPVHLPTACLTTDFAMQNVLLQMNLNLLSANTLKRVRHLKTHILRCYACFLTTKDMSKQFCPRCGKPTFTRVTCTTKQNGQVIMHLKKNMQWNKRGDVFSIPKPVAGSSNQKRAPNAGGGQGGWGSGLILAPDQKEYTRAMDEKTRRSRKERDLMDEDYLPGILTGERKGGDGALGGAGGRIRVGAGRSVNAKKRG